MVKYLSLIDKYDSNIIECKNYIKYEINYLFLIELFEEYSKCEDDEYKKNHDEYFNKSFVYHTKESKLDNYGSLNKNYKLKKLFHSNWRTNYYKELFNMNIYGDNLINDICLKYIQGLYWISNYYFNKISTSNWYYPYNYSPSILDLYNYYVTHNDIHIVNSFNKPYEINTDIQLLMILPINSIKLLNRNTQSLMMFPSSISHLYPLNFDIQTYQKAKLHECCPILPTIDFKSIQLSYLNIIS
jgi:5'-3' exonuclease